MLQSTLTIQNMINNGTMDYQQKENKTKKTKQKNLQYYSYVTRTNANMIL